jgi:phosphate transport system permease protein
MIKKIALKTATPAIIGAIILAVSRAIGETMIVTMAAGLVAKLTINPFDSVTTATAQIVSLLVGDQEFGSPKTLAAFALALVLFVLTLIFNVVALIISKRYKQKYG